MIIVVPRQSQVERSHVLHVGLAWLAGGGMYRAVTRLRGANDRVTFISAEASR